MQFNIKSLKKLLSSSVKNQVNYISIKSHNLEITINRTKNNLPISSKTLPPKHPTNYTIKNKTVQENKKKISSNETDNYFTIVSPMIGTFYRSPAPNESSFINLNDQITVNQTVCIIEAMKLMNEIQSEVEGQIVEILVEDGDIVDCGQALIRVKHKE